MLDSLSLYTLGLTLGVVTCASLAFIGFSRSYVSGALSFALLMIAASFYALGSLFEIRGRSVEELHFWLSVEYIGIAFVGPLWLHLALSVSGYHSRRLSLMLSALYGLSAVILAMVWTNDEHHLYYSSLSLAYRGPFSISVVGRGPFYWINLAMLNSCVLAANAILLVRMAKAAQAYRKQAFFIFLASLFPWAGMLIYTTGLSPYGLDIAPFCIPLSGILFSWSLFRYRFVDLGVIACEKIIESMSEGVLVLDGKGRSVAVNLVMMKALGVEGARARVKDCIGESALEMLAPCPDLAALVERGLPASADIGVEGPGGTRHYSARYSSITGRRSRPLGFILSISDITERVKLTERLAELATVDELTGVMNRRTILKNAQDECARAARQKLALSVLMLDLDEFKKINDLFGHQAGDAILRASARACASAIRGTDRIGRYGGEEFLAVLPGIGPSEAMLAAERLRAAVASVRVESGGESLGVTVSIGCSGRESYGGETIDDLVREADEALYRAKAGGRNRIELHR